MMFQINTLPKTFLAANSAKGFVSYFKECYSADDGWKAYIIKGGPGTGKSSMMKSLAAYFADKGERVELCACSSDPDSLDAVIFFDRKVVIMDGTSPHTVDPSFPGVCETIVNLSDCWDDAKLQEGREEILKLTRENKAHHARASRYITAAGTLLSDINKTASQFVNTEKTAAYAQKLANRLISEGDEYKEHIRFLSGVTPKGLLFFKNTPQKMANTIIAVEDEWGAVRDIIMSIIKNVAKTKKQERYILPCLFFYPKQSNSCCFSTSVQLLKNSSISIISLYLFLSASFWSSVKSLKLIPVGLDSTFIGLESFFLTIGFLFVSTFPITNSPSFFT